MSETPASLSGSTQGATRVCLRLAFEASSMPRAVALAEQLELLSGEPTEIHPLEPLPIGLKKAK